MADLAFLNIIKELVKLKELTHEITNVIIEKYYPELDFMDEGKSRVYFKTLVPWKLKDLKKHNLKAVFQGLNKIYPKLYANKTTLDNIFSTDVRNIISKRFGVNSPEHKMSKKLVALSYEEKGSILKDAKDKVFKKNSNRTTFSTERIFSIITENIDSDDMFKKAVALLVASGSRPIELFEKANYTKDDANWIKQDFLAKKKGEISDVIKPVLYISADTFIKELKVMRDKLHKKYPSFLQKNGQLSTTINKKANEAAKEIFEYEEGLTLYTARKLYGKLSYDLYHKTTDRFGNNPKLENWLSNVLGHKEGSTSAAANYSNFDLTNKDSEKPTDEILAKQAVIETKLDSLEERFNQKNVPKISKESSGLINNRKVEESFESISSIYYEQAKAPNQSQLEKLAKSVASRTNIRLWYKNNFKS